VAEVVPREDVDRRRFRLHRGWRRNRGGRARGRSSFGLGLGLASAFLLPSLSSHRRRRRRRRWRGRRSVLEMQQVLTENGSTPRLAWQKIGKW
jgi:hypothetical protein